MPTKPRRAFSLRALSGLFRRPTANAARPLSPTDFHNMPPMSPSQAVHTYPPYPPSTLPAPMQMPTSSLRKRALSIRSFRSTKSTKSKGQMTLGIENIPIPPVPVRAARARVHSFSGYLSLSDDDSEEADAEVRAIEREALEMVRKINENYRYVAEGEIGVAL
ncbi:hypothetical protein FB45DRAFT_1097500 [Roridomyces roridus]|uniref:Uncharacterized protein n=1 Tax=Roridomyces roridus TaxID=1738132 RepID=A0AAD7BEL8_9AGAR|nr:hypothetical protein FB45DRAFT_1097500 [Roridomyces roridus]